MVLLITPPKSFAKLIKSFLSLNELIKRYSSKKVWTISTNISPSRSFECLVWLRVCIFWRNSVILCSTTSLSALNTDSKYLFAIFSISYYCWFWEWFGKICLKDSITVRTNLLTDSFGAGALWLSAGPLRKVCRCSTVSKRRSLVRCAFSSTRLISLSIFFCSSLFSCSGEAC